MVYMIIQYTYTHVHMKLKQKFQEAILIFELSVFPTLSISF